MQSYFRNENEIFLHFVLGVRKQELRQFLTKRYKNKNYNGKTKENENYYKIKTKIKTSGKPYSNIVPIGRA